MAVSRVNISFQDDLLSQIDQVAQDEAKTRDELIGEAARVYTQTKKLERIFAYWHGIAEKYNITEEDLNEEIRKYREEKNAR